MWPDLRFAFRTLVRSALFAVTTVAALALGIGANTAIFSVINGLLLHPAGIPHPDHLMAIRVKYDKLNLKSIVISAPDFADVRDSKQIFSAAALLREEDFNYTASDLPERLLGASVSWQWFEVFGVKPLLGRAFRPEEDQANANHVVVLGYGTWQRLFGGDPAIVGKKILLNQQSYQVVGVMGREFNWPNEAQLWLPIGLPPGEFAADNRFNEDYLAVASIRTGVSVAQAEAYVRVLTRQLIEAHRDPYYRDSGWGIFVLPLTEFVYGDLKAPLFVLLGAVGFVLLIACSNVAGLMLARETGRAKQLAVRAALGASQWQLIRQTLTEGLLLAAAGTLLGLGLAAAGVRVLLRLTPQNVAAGMEIRLDTYVLLFTAVVGVMAGLVAAIAPALRLSGVQNFELLKEGGRSGTASRGRLRVRGLLVTGQVALALVLLVGAGLFMKSLGRLEQLSPGFDARGVMTASLSLPEAQYRQDEQMDDPYTKMPRQKEIAFYRTAVERLADTAGVQSAAAAYPLPFSGDAASSSFEIQNRPLGPGDPGPHSDLFAVTAGYFPALKIPLLEGRTFTDQDREGGQPVVVIDENLARRYWPGQDPVGKQLRRGDNSPWATIVGVVAHVHHSVLAGDTGKGVCYYPLFQMPVPGVYFVARTGADPSRLAGSIREAVRSVDATLPVSDLKTMEDRVASSLAPRRFAVTLLGFFAALALAMAALGLYGVVSYAVTEQTREIGIRMALGAERRQVLAMIVSQGLQLVAGGIAFGLVAAFILARLVASQLFEVRTFDPVTFVLMVLLLIVVALTASYVPARRAAKVDPMVALRHE
jgi:predicted permease